MMRRWREKKRNYQLIIISFGCDDHYAAFLAFCFKIQEQSGGDGRLDDACNSISILIVVPGVITFE